MQTGAHLTCKQQLTSKQFYCILITVCMLLVGGICGLSLLSPILHYELNIIYLFNFHYALLYPSIQAPHGQPDCLY